MASAERVVRITTAGTPHAQELAARQRRYVISMTIRTACFIGAILVEGPLRWVLVAGAVFLPYIAVVMANTAGPRDDDFVPEAPARLGLPAPSADERGGALDG